MPEKVDDQHAGDAVADALVRQRERGGTERREVAADQRVALQRDRRARGSRAKNHVFASHDSESARENQHG